jgi:hypothetical protein
VHRFTPCRREVLVALGAAALLRPSIAHADGGWDGYIKRMVEGGCAWAAIYGANPVTIWARTENLGGTGTIEPGDLQTIADAFRDTTALKGGLHLQGLTYLYVKGDATMLEAKKAMTGFIAWHTKTAVVLGGWQDGQQIGGAILSVGTVAQALIDAGY